ncbi:MAG: hypothetical protein WC729_09250 [Sphingomonas sp.]|jgi:hypothetical protein|uniref:hypothetical protein n=1 Tax=Sphingomonas sp. TaxID=28214 RepID=UPI0035617BBC
MHASHSIEVDAEIGFVRYTLAGFFDEASLTSLRTERATMLPRLKTRPNQHVTLCDVSQCSIQSKESLAALRVMLAQPEWRARRLAFVVGGALARMQTRRIVDDIPNVQWFGDTASAEAWLAEASQP